ncbi:hypothetical protein CBW65_17770 [Tumebacillus avium]|uniref:VanZ-like domain-containing protein n=1 Tax=Tumebacillus avium TaxID=1903704 RepID=A0A1Y0IQ14_9BACL|nr:hypothetical protein [Tumebacillus avium]ARU62611.1 hypothetical protein CBW65_17770 [Tumebacillus avium]
MDLNYWRRYLSWIRTPRVLLNLSLLAGTYALYLLNEHVWKELTNNAFLHGHFNDALAMWIFLPYINLLLSFYPYRVISITSIPACLGLALLSGLGWEYLTPLFLTRSVSDPIDVVMYLISGMTYALFVKKVTVS